MLFGIINVNKPRNFTSHQVVARIRKILGIKQVGHTGTLDPLADGVLPICTGKATRIIEYLDTTKSYRAYILLGVRTDSYDTDGNVLQKVEVKPDIEEIKSALEGFRGKITQTPPIYSAVHYKGKRLYEYARKNIEISDIPSRTVFIKDIKLISLDGMVAVVDVDCSGGTYIRSIAHDLGEKLGYGACIQGLTRTMACGLRIEDSFTLEDIEKNSPENFLIPPQNAIDLEIIEITKTDKEEISNGRYINSPEEYSEEKLVQLVCAGVLVAIAKTSENRILPLKVLC